MEFIDLKLRMPYSLDITVGILKKRVFYIKLYTYKLYTLCKSRNLSQSDQKVIKPIS